MHTVIQKQKESILVWCCRCFDDVVLQYRRFPTRPSACPLHVCSSLAEAGRQAAIGFTPLLGNDINIPLNTQHPLPHTTQ
jgi:hypothetical protein